MKVCTKLVMIMEIMLVTLLALFVLGEFGLSLYGLRSRNSCLIIAKVTVALFPRFA
jgi:hypothetical protein